MFHRHVWRVVSRETKQSPLAQAMMEALKLPGDLNVGGPPGTLREYEIVIYRCETCGSEKVERV